MGGWRLHSDRCPIPICAGWLSMRPPHQTLASTVGAVRSVRAAVRAPALERRQKYACPNAPLRRAHTPKAIVYPDPPPCLLYTSDAADDLLCVDLGGRRIIKKK